MVKTAAAGAYNDGRNFVVHQAEEAKLGEHFQQINNNVQGQYN